MAEYVKEYGANGVCVRADGKGDRWANEHRTELPHNYLMQDIDGIIGLQAFSAHSTDTIFAEYVAPKHRSSQLIRTYGLVSVFDRKSDAAAAVCDASSLSTGFYLWLCRAVTASQPVQPHFFFVVGTGAPWSLLELDIRTGRIVLDVELKTGQWLEAWDRLGLTEARNVLWRWLHSDAC